MQEQTNEHETEQPNDQGNQNVVTETATEPDVTSHRTQYEPAEPDTLVTDTDGA